MHMLVTLRHITLKIKPFFTHIGGSEVDNMETDTTVNSPAIKQLKSISLHYHLFELLNSKQD